MNLGAWVTIVATAALLVANYRKSRAAEWIAKPIAAAGFVVSALQHGALGSTYGVCVLVALCRPYAAGAPAVPASNRQIAEELVLGVETVKTHMRALAEAFGLEDLPQHQKRATLAARALDLGVVGPEDLAAG